MSVLQWVWLVFSMVKWLYEVISEEAREKPELANGLKTSGVAAMRRLVDSGNFSELDKFIDDNGLRLKFEHKRVMKEQTRRARRDSNFRY